MYRDFFSATTPLVLTEIYFSANSNNPSIIMFIPVFVLVRLRVYIDWFYDVSKFIQILLQAYVCSIHLYYGPHIQTCTISSTEQQRYRPLFFASFSLNGCSCVRVCSLVGARRSVYITRNVCIPFILCYEEFDL